MTAGTGGAGVRRAALAIAVGLAVVPAAVNGFGRFAYALILPGMREALGWSALTAGAMNAANAVGYLLGAALADRVSAWAGERTAILGSMGVCGLSVLGCAGTENTALLLVLRAVGGVTAAFAFIAGGALVTRLSSGAEAKRAGRVLGVYFSAPGVGIAVSAGVIGPIAGVRTWQECWLLLGLLSLLCTLVAAVVLRGAPTARPADPGQRHREWDKRTMAPMLASYGLFGAGYIAYMTFAVAYLKDEGLESMGVIGFWLTIGVVGVALSVTLFPVLQHIRDGRGVALLIGIVTIGSFLPLISPVVGLAVVSAALFATFLSVTAAVAAQARHHLPSSQWAPAIAGLTTAFGVGQCAGPLLAGLLSDSPGGLRAGLLIGTVLLALGSLAALTAPRAHRVG